MGELGWLTRALADVPPDDRWLSERERRVLSALRIPKRHAEWRLGRWAAKAALALSQGLPASEVEVMPTPGGAPEAFAGGVPIPVGLSLSHRAGRALVAVGRRSATVGCDLEVVEPRSPAFIRQWLRPAERELLSGLDAESRDLMANLLWTAKEAASKARGEGLRLDLRHAGVALGRLDGSPDSWRQLRVAWDGGPRVRGWWRSEPGWVMAVVSQPGAGAPPRELRG